MRSRYDSAPLHRSPERGVLYVEYRQGVEERKARLKDVEQRESAALVAIRQRWEIKRRDLERMSIDKRKRRGLLHLARKHEAEGLAKAKLQFQEPREAVRREIPYTGKELFFSPQGAASEIALRYGRKKWEKDIRIEGNRLCLGEEREQ